MKCMFSDLRYKEVINVCDGQRMGYFCDAEIASAPGDCVCGASHTGPFAGLIRFFHRILYFFKNLFGNN